VTKPLPGTGQSEQTTTTEYDTSLRGWRITYPDGAKLTNELFLTGLMKKITGSRNYPVEYTYSIPDRCGSCGGGAYGGIGHVISTLQGAFISNPDRKARVNEMKAAIVRDLNEGLEFDYDRQEFNHAPPL
jgi:hypothetical protein